MTDIQGEQKKCGAILRRNGRDPSGWCNRPAGHAELHGDEGNRTAKVFPVTLMPPDGLNATSFTESLMRMYIHDAGRHLTPPMFVPTSPMQIAANRNQAARFLLDDSDADWLLFIDSDMGWQPDAVELLLAAAHPDPTIPTPENPIIGGLCFGMRKQEDDSFGGFRSEPFPTVYDFDGPKGFFPRYNYTPDAITRCAGTGAAFLMIHRGALQQMREVGGDEWFTRAKLYPDGETMGEDLSFCLRAGGLGIPIFVHTGVRTTHLKPVWVGEPFYRANRPDR